eukprot:2063889-Rhodomonas_salina.5
MADFFDLFAFVPRASDLKKGFQLRNVPYRIPRRTVPPVSTKSYFRSVPDSRSVPELAYAVRRNIAEDPTSACSPATSLTSAAWYRSGVGQYRTPRRR